MEFQSPVLVITTIKPTRAEPLTALLRELNHALWQGDVNPFGEFNLQHFARWVVINDQLIFAAAVDGSAEKYLQQLAHHCLELLTSIYTHCENFPETELSNGETVANYLLTHQEQTHMFYHGLRNRKVADIQLESQIHRSIEVFLDGNQHSNSFRANNPTTIVETIKAHLKGTGIEYESNDPHFHSRLPPTTKAAAWWRWPLLIGAIVGALCLAPVILYKEWRERREPSGQNPFIADSQPSDLDFEEIQAIQSPMTSIVAIKPGWFRGITLRAVLWAIQMLADHYYNKGRLGSIGSIHFARWAIINNGRHLLFLSNYDGSWESYLGDFIDRAAHGLTGVWGNAVGFPHSKFLLWGGASHAADFKAYAKRSQVATHFWYSAYPQLSMPNKLNNRSIRAFLMDSKKSSAKHWLRRF